MSSDFGFWNAVPGDPGDIFDNLAEGITDGLMASGNVLRFREELLARLPDLKDVTEPPEYAVEQNPEDAEKYVLLTLGYRQLDHLEEILDLAKAHRLVGYSGVAGEPISFDD